MSFIVLKPQDSEQIVAFEKDQLQRQNIDPVDIELLSWKAPWRPESLDHYLPMGWSMGLFNQQNGQLEAYFLAQPLLFFRQMTQTLWVEHLGYPLNEPKKAEQLIELGYRLARDKHLQKMLLPILNLDAVDLEVWRPSPIGDEIMEIKTAKL